MAEICLTSLNSQQVKAISAHPYPATKMTSFLEYCSLNWGAHAKRDLSDGAGSLALALLRDCDNQISLKLIMIEHASLRFEDFEEYDRDFPFSGLDCASFFGIGDLGAALIKMECYDINKGGFCGKTPLAWAASEGHEEVVKIPLDHEEVDPDIPDEFGYTPLSFKPRNWVRANRANPGLIRVGLGRVGSPKWQTWVGPKKPEIKPEELSLLFIKSQDITHIFQTCCEP